MKVLWCWRCKMEVQILDDGEFGKAQDLYCLGFKVARQDRWQPLLNYYKELTGFEETNPSAICIIESFNTAPFAKIVINLTELHWHRFVLPVAIKEVNLISHI